MNNILISGITGFVGGNLKKYLLRKYNIVGISRKSNSSEDIINYDEITNDYFNKAEAFVHLAGKAHDLKKVSSDKEYYIINRDLTIKLFNVFLESSCKIFIYVSSVKAAKDSIDEVLTEEHIPDPKTVYGKSKLEAENYILSKKIPKDKKVFIIRPCMIHGPNNKGNLNLLYSFVSKRVPYPLGSYSNKRSFICIDNFCFLITQLLEKKPKPGIYNFADDDAISTKDLVALIGSEINKKAIILNVPKLIISIFARVGDVIKLPLTTEKLDKLTENYVVSNRKIKEAMSVSKLPLSVKEGLILTIKSFNKN